MPGDGSTFAFVPATVTCTVSTAANFHLEGGQGGAAIGYLAAADAASYGSTPPATLPVTIDWATGNGAYTAGPNAATDKLTGIDAYNPPSTGATATLTITVSAAGGGGGTGGGGTGGGGTGGGGTGGTGSGGTGSSTSGSTIGGLGGGGGGGGCAMGGTSSSGLALLAACGIGALFVVRRRRAA